MDVLCVLESDELFRCDFYSDIEEEIAGEVSRFIYRQDQLKEV